MFDKNPCFFINKTHIENYMSLDFIEFSLKDLPIRKYLYLT